MLQSFLCTIEFSFLSLVNCGEHFRRDLAYISSIDMIARQKGAQLFPLRKLFLESKERTEKSELLNLINGYSENNSVCKHRVSMSLLSFSLSTHPNKNIKSCIRHCVGTYTRDRTSSGIFFGRKYLLQY